MSNPFITAISGILNDLKLWGLALIGGVATVVIVMKALGYSAADEMERKEIKKSIRNTIIMAGGVYALIWIASYVIDKMKVVS